jgi:EmrB/QacA subfamily drug resistance transporter
MTEPAKHPRVPAPDDSAFHAAAGFTPRRRSLALVVVALAFVMDLLDTTIVNVALPSIGHSFGAGNAALEWVIAGYAIAFAVLLIIGGRLGDSFGYRRMFLGGISLFTLASLWCGLATSVGMLELARLLQGATAAIMVPQVMALVQVMYPPAERYKVYAVFGFLGGFSAALGPIVGGLLIDADWFGLGWRLTFLINLPIGLFALAAGASLLPGGRGVDAAGVDVGGALLSMATLFALLVPLIEGPGHGWPAWSVAMLAATVPLALCTAAYLRWRDRAHGDALIRPALFRRRRVTLGLLCSLCINPVIPGYLLVMTFVLQAGRGFSAAQMAYSCAPIALGAMFGISLLGPRLHKALGVRVLVPAAIVMAASLCIVAYAANTDALTLWALAIGQFGMGVGLGLSGPPLSHVTLQDVPLADAGVASGMFTAVQQLAGALGVALAGLVFFHFAPQGGDVTALRYAGAYLMVLPLFLVLLLAGLLISLKLPSAAQS